MKHFIMMFAMAAALMTVSGPALAKGTMVAAAKEKSPAVKALEGLRLRQHSGVVSQYDPAKGSLVIKNRKGEHQFAISGDTQIKRGRTRLGADALKAGMNVTVRYWEKDGQQVARIVKLIAD